MKFYKDKFGDYFWRKIRDNNYTAIYYDYYVSFLKNGNYHNEKNATNYDGIKFKEFYLNNKCYGNHNDFTKKSWRKFVKLKVFL